MASRALVITLSILAADLAADAFLFPPLLAHGQDGSLMQPHEPSSEFNWLRLKAWDV